MSTKTDLMHQGEISDCLINYTNPGGLKSAFDYCLYDLHLKFHLFVHYMFPILPRLKRFTICDKAVYINMPITKQTIYFMNNYFSSYVSYCCYSLRVFTPALADGLSLEFEWQQVCTSLQESSRYFGLS